MGWNKNIQIGLGESEDIRPMSLFYRAGLGRVQAFQGSSKFEALYTTRYGNERGEMAGQGGQAWKQPYHSHFVQEQ